MRSGMLRWAKRFGRLVLVIFFVMTGSVTLVRFAPGFFTDAREMDGRYRAIAENALANERATNGSWTNMIRVHTEQWLHGNLGESRQFEVPVSDLVKERIGVTGALLGKSILLAWILAITAACLSNLGRNLSALLRLPAALLLSIPASALATFCIVSNWGGAVLVLTTLIAVRDFKFVDRLLHKTWREPYLEQARAQGLGTWRMFTAHVMPSVAPDLLSLALLSINTALGALIPVEVLFDIPGIGQMTWNAAINRDLPVMAAATLLMAVVFTVSGSVMDWESRGAAL